MGMWYFPHNGHGRKTGFNDAGIDLFHGDPVGSLVRESIQNSLDAAVTDKHTVRVVFTLSQPDREGQEIATGLLPAMDLGLTKAKKNKQKKAIHFYDKATGLLRGDQGIRVLGIHDFETRGLTGTTDDTLGDSSPWLALVKGSGETVKEKEGAGGSYGHGSSAPLVLSELRSVLYFSRISGLKEPEERFQGTTRLESLPAQDLIGVPGLTQDQGHYGDGPKCGPLFSEEIPSWFRNARAAAMPEGTTVDTGTSIYVMAPRVEGPDGLFWKKVLIAVLANYYYTIALGKLEVFIGDEYTLNPDTISDHLASLELFDVDDSVLGTKDTLDRLETSRTIAGLHEVHNISVPEFGSVDLLIRFDDSIDRSHVGVARSNGMLITREPWLLTSDSVRGFRRFDLFVYVKDEQGSEILRQLEPPEHNAFQISRIEDEDLKKEIQKSYKIFKAMIMDFLKRIARFEVVEEVVLDDLSKYFLANWTGDIAGDKDPTNYKPVYSSFRRVKAKQGVAVWGNPDQSVGVAPRIGVEDKGRKKKGGTSNFDDPVGEPEKENRTTRRQVDDFRVVRDPKNLNVATVYLTPVDKEHRHLVILRSGADTSPDPIRFRTERSGKWLTRLDLVSVSKGQRKKLRLEFAPGSLVYALEARLES